MRKATACSFSFVATAPSSALSKYAGSQGSLFLLHHSSWPWQKLSNRCVRACRIGDSCFGGKRVRSCLVRRSCSAIFGLMHGSKMNPSAMVDHYFRAEPPHHPAVKAGLQLQVTGKNQPTSRGRIDMRIQEKAAADGGDAQDRAETWHPQVF